MKGRPTGLILYSGDECEDPSEEEEELDFLNGAQPMWYGFSSIMTHISSLVMGFPHTAHISLLASKRNTNYNSFRGLI
jgi:hypothetical protein